MGIKLFLLVSDVQCPAKCSVLPTYGYFHVANAQLSKLKFESNFFFQPFFQLACLVSASIAASRPRHSRTPWDSLMQRLRREVVDLHSGEFCVDVSTFGEVQFEPTDREKCDTTFEKQCETKNEQVGKEDLTK